MAENADLKLALSLTSLIDDIMAKIGQTLADLKSQTFANLRNQCQCGVICESLDDTALSNWSTAEAEFREKLNSLKSELNERITAANSAELITVGHGFAVKDSIEHSDLLNVEQFLKTTFVPDDNDFVAGSGMICFLN